MPREICFLPLEVLLVSNNRLVSLPEELGRMEQLTELDAACNQITHLPVRIGDLGSLRSLSLRNNQLLYLPKGLCSLSVGHWMKIIRFSVFRVDVSSTCFIGHKL